MQQQDPPVSPGELRTFGLVLAAFVAVALGLLAPWVLDRPMPRWPWVVAVVTGLWALLAPATLAPVHHAMSVFGRLMGKITTPLLMTLVFVLTIVPTALVMRLFRRDPLQRRLDADVESYRVVNKPDAERSLDNPF